MLKILNMRINLYYIVVVQYNGFVLEQIEVKIRMVMTKMQRFLYERIDYKVDVINEMGILY